MSSSPGFNRYGSSYEANLGASWELDISGGLRRGREAALAEYQASEAGAVATRLTVAAQTADIYISIRGLQARLELARKQVQTQQDLLSTIKLLYGKGLAAELQVNQAEGALAQVRASVPSPNVSNLRERSSKDSPPAPSCRNRRQGIWVGTRTAGGHRLDTQFANKRISVWTLGWKLVKFLNESWTSIGSG